jgi:hypothetical protein
VLQCFSIDANSRRFDKQLGHATATDRSRGKSVPAATLLADLSVPRTAQLRDVGRNSDASLRQLL